MSSPVLSRKHYAPNGRLELFPNASLPYGRVHECSGIARESFAMMIAAQMQGSIIWIAPQFQRETFLPDGMHAYIDPARVITVRPKHLTETLVTIEDCLRSGAVSLVLAHLQDIPTLTQIRRLHLAGEAPQAAQGPLTLLLTPDQGGCPGVETRWQMSPDGLSRWSLIRTRARMAPPAHWSVTWHQGCIRPVKSHIAPNAQQKSQKFFPRSDTTQASQTGNFSSSIRI